MFRLGHHVGGDVIQIRGGIGDNQHLGRPRLHVYPHRAGHLPLRFDHPTAAGPQDLVDPGDGAGPEGQRANCLSPSDAKQPGDSGKGAGCKDRIVESGRWRHDDDVFDSGLGRRNRIHDHGRGIGRLAARHVEADAVQRGHSHSQQTAVLLQQRESDIPLALVILANPLEGGFQRFPQLDVDAFEGIVPLGTRQLPRGGIEIHPIQPPGPLAHGGVPSLGHVVQDPRDLLAQFPVYGERFGEEWFETVERWHRNLTDHLPPSRVRGIGASLP